MKKQKSKFAKVLIANRGEIALRAVKTARKLGLQSVAIYSTADKSSQHVIQADEAICIGPAPSSKSYLVKNAIIHTALSFHVMRFTRVRILSENAEFVDLCEANDIKFIGPAAESIREMGDKSTARKLAVKNNVPVYLVQMTPTTLRTKRCSPQNLSTIHFAKSARRRWRKRNANCQK